MDSEARERRVAKEEPTSSSKDFEAMSQQQRPDLVERYMSLEMGSRKDRTRATLQEVAKQFARFPGDTGSSDVQVALLTSKIALLAEHVKAHPKDHSSRRGLRAMLHGRRQLLQYLRRTQFDRYAKVISRLGLKDSFGPQDRFTQRYS
jgi:small subunit ribosomal protein S15